MTTALSCSRTTEPVTERETLVSLADVTFKMKVIVSPAGRSAIESASRVTVMLPVTVSPTDVANVVLLRVNSTPLDGPDCCQYVVL